MDGDSVALEFPGDGWGKPSDEEWQRADERAGRTLNRNNPARRSTFAPWWGNRAYLRSQVRRALYANYNAARKTA